ARQRGLDRLEVRRRNLIRAEEFPYLIPSGTSYDSGDYHAVIDKVLARIAALASEASGQRGHSMMRAPGTRPEPGSSARANYVALIAERDRLRGQGLLAGVGMAACLEPSGANSTFEPLLNPKNETTTYT